MFAIVGGGGKVGYYLGKELIEQGHEVLIIEQDMPLVTGLVIHNGAPAAGLEQLATLAFGHAFAAAPSLGDVFAVDAVVMHHDAPPAA